MIRDKGRPPYRNWYAAITEKQVTAPNRLKLVFENGENRELPLLIALAPIYSKATTDAENFDKSSLNPPTGTGRTPSSPIETGMRANTPKTQVTAPNRLKLYSKR